MTEPNVGAAVFYARTGHKLGTIEVAQDGRKWLARVWWPWVDTFRYFVAYEDVALFRARSRERALEKAERWLAKQQPTDLSWEAVPA